MNIGRPVSFSVPCHLFLGLPLYGISGGLRSLRCSLLRSSLLCKRLFTSGFFAYHQKIGTNGVHHFAAFRTDPARSDDRRQLMDYDGLESADGYVSRHSSPLIVYFFISPEAHCHIPPELYIHNVKPS